MGRLRRQVEHTRNRVRRRFGLSRSPSGPDDLPRLASIVGRDWAEAPYYAEAEEHIDAQWEAFVWPFIADAEFAVVVDLAAGRGRNSAKLAPLCGQLHIVDINSTNIEYCQRRFASASNISCHLNDGCTLPFIQDSSVTLVYCFDAMVHFDSDIVRSYLAETKRILRPGGRGFFHHSNFFKNPAGDVHDNPGWRNFMSAELFEHYASKGGLTVRGQQIVDWDAPASDCFSLVERPL